MLATLCPVRGNQFKLAVGLAERFHNFPILVEVCVLSGDQHQLHGFVDRFKDQVISCYAHVSSGHCHCLLPSTGCPCRGLLRSSTNTTFKRVGSCGGLLCGVCALRG